MTNRGRLWRPTIPVLLFLDCSFAAISSILPFIPSLRNSPRSSQTRVIAGFIGKLSKPMQKARRGAAPPRSRSLNLVANWPPGHPGRRPRRAVYPSDGPSDDRCFDERPFSAWARSMASLNDPSATSADPRSWSCCKGSTLSTATEGAGGLSV